MACRAMLTRFLGGVVLLQCVSVAAFAQSSGVGAIGGAVSDTTGAVLPGVSVQLTHPDGSVGGDRTAVTDARGVYRFAGLVPGSYAVRAEIPGFKTTLRNGVVVNADATARVDFTLELGALADEVIVTAQPQLLDPSGL